MNSSIGMDDGGHDLTALWSGYFGPTWVKVVMAVTVLVCLGPGLYLLAFVMKYAADARYL